ncbi:MAG: hypothetical protein AB1585_15250 [Thermodesulfobacteriota bacterium]
MTGPKTQAVQMLADLIRDAQAGKKISLKTKFISDVITVKRNGKSVETNELSVEYSGKDDGNPFKIKKNYLFSEDAVRHPMECLLIANNRLQLDYTRLKRAGIDLKEEFFTFKNAHINGPAEGSTKKVPYRLQDFILLSRAGVPVTVRVILKYPDLVLKQEGLEKKGFACVADYKFQTPEGGKTVEKLYGFGSFDEVKSYQTEVKVVATKRLERDFDRLRRAGMKIEKMRF